MQDQMASTNKFKNIMRFKSFMASGINVVMRPAAKGQNMFSEILKQKLKEIKISPMTRKMEVAKGFYQLEMAPAKIDEMGKLRSDLNYVKQFIKHGGYNQLTVREAWLLFLVCIEVGLWFFMGETIGKMHIVGYKV